MIELELEVTDAAHSSLNNYESLSAQGRAWNIVHPNNKVCQAILVPFWSIREEHPSRNMARHNKKTNLKCQSHIDNALASTGKPITGGVTAQMEDNAWKRDKILKHWILKH